MIALATQKNHIVILEQQPALNACNLVIAQAMRIYLYVKLTLEPVQNVQKTLIVLMRLHLFAAKIPLHVSSVQKILIVQAPQTHHSVIALISSALNVLKTLNALHLWSVAPSIA